jgi:CDP-paratose 2-epimerase
MSGAPATSAPVLITGGAGFIGTNLAMRLLAAGRRVRVFDDLSRAGAERNLSWLRAAHPDRLEVRVADVRDAAAVQAAVEGTSLVYHLAAQVAVTTSLSDPVSDFDVNARGTLHVLEAVRACSAPPPLLYTSTNKVYGGLGDVALRRGTAGYEPLDETLRAHGVAETRRLDFHSPYGCSKGAADQYVVDYARSYGVHAAVVRMSCVYGPRQYGTEDQGWVAHFMIRARLGEPVTVYGDGGQVRDLLYIDDLVDALCAAEASMPALRGRAWNVGGGVANSASLLGIVKRIGAVHGAPPRVRHADWRGGDQRWYASDVRAFAAATGWWPRTRPADGIARLDRWLDGELAPRTVRRQVARELV